MTATCFTQLTILSLINQYGAFHNVLYDYKIYNNKTKGPNLMELFTNTGKLNKFLLQLEMFDVCTNAAMIRASRHGSLQQ
jgi:hypothetical protein